MIFLLRNKIKFNQLLNILKTNLHTIIIYELLFVS